MAGVNIGNANLTYTKFQTGVVETLNQEARTFKLPRQEIWQGQQIEGRIHTARSTAMSFTEDGGAFSVADKQDYTPYKVSRRFYEASIQLTDGIMAAAKQSPNVAKDVLESEVRGMMTGALKYYNLFFFRDGTGTVSTLKGATLVGSNNIDVDDARLMWDGGTYQLFDSTLTTNRGNAVVAKVESALNGAGNALVDFTAAIPVGAAINDRFVWNGSVNRAISGLDALIDDAATVFQDVNVANFPRYSSMVLDNSGVPRALTPGLLRAMLAGIRQKSGNDRPAQGLVVIGDSWQAVEFEEMYEGELRLDTSDTTQGYQGLSFVSALGKVNLESDTDCLRGKIFAIDPTKLYHAVQRPLGWRMQDGQIFLRSDVSGVHTATMLCISQMYIKERFTCGKIEDLDDDAVTAY